ncbi:hypothetical protein ACLHDG_14335 [Sulfurovum sp. CS9]|uniref:hypothetical protein n=1 Tax=Sulfurovum sp. CS9 TaxID=3391146 RepID=UPI0039E93E80
MQSKTFENTYLYLRMKYNTFFVNKDIVAHEMDVEIATINARVASKMSMPPYIKIGDSNNSKLVVTLVDLAYYISEGTGSILSETERREYIYQYFTNKYPRLLLSKRDFANELGVCDNTLGTYIQKKYICKTRRQGTSSNAKIIFNSNDISDFFSRVIQTM